MQASTTWPVQDMPELVQSTLDTWPFNRELYSTISMQCVAATRTRLVCPLGPWRATTPPAELYSFRPHPHTPYNPQVAFHKRMPWPVECHGGGGAPQSHYATLVHAPVVFALRASEAHAKAAGEAGLRAGAQGIQRATRISYLSPGGHVDLLS